MWRPLLVLLLCSGCAHLSRPSRGPVLLDTPRASFVALFPEELASLTEALSEFLREKGFSVDTETYPSLRALSAAGKTRPDGPVCAARPTTFSLVQQRHGEVPRANATVSCFEAPCMLGVYVARTVGPRTESVAEWRAEIDSPVTTGSLRKAAGELHVPPPVVSGLLGGLGMRRRQPVRVRISGIVTTGKWTTQFSLGEVLPVQPALDACHAPGWNHASEDTAVVEVGRSGAVTRCHVYGSRDPDEPSRLDCLCDALSAIRAPEGEEGRRVEVRLINEPSSTVDVGNRVVGVRVEGVKSEQLEPHIDAPASLGLLSGSGIGVSLRDLAACVAGAPPEKPLRAPFTLEVDSLGNATRATVELGDFTEEARACLEMALATAKVPCPEGSGARVTGALVAWSYEQPAAK